MSWTCHLESRGSYSFSSLRRSFSRKPQMVYISIEGNVKNRGAIWVFMRCFYRTQFLGVFFVFRKFLSSSNFRIFVRSGSSPSLTVVHLVPRVGNVLSVIRKDCRENEPHSLWPSSFDHRHCEEQFVRGVPKKSASCPRHVMFDGVKCTVSYCTFKNSPRALIEERVSSFSLELAQKRWRWREIAVSF